MLDALPSPTSYPAGSKPEAALSTLTRAVVNDAIIYTLELTNRPDNRLTLGLLEPLDDIEREWRADRHGELKGGPGTGKAALVTTGPQDAMKFYSNGLNLDLAVKTPGFFKDTFHFALGRMLTFPIPTICAIMGHAFAGGFVLALAHDYRVLKHGEGKAGAMMALNEVDFGAHIPAGMVAIVRSKLSPGSITPVILGERLVGQRAVDLGIVQELAAGPQETLKIAQKRAAALAPKAAAGAWGAIKEGVYADYLPAIAQDENMDRGDEDGRAAARLGPKPRQSHL